MGVRTGNQYIEGLRDDRRIYINGERVRDVTKYPPLQRVIWELAALCDRQHEQNFRDVLTYCSPSSGEPVSTSFLIPTTFEDVERRVRGEPAVNSAGWSRSSPGTCWSPAVSTVSSATPAIWGCSSTRWAGVWPFVRGSACCSRRSLYRRSSRASVRKSGCCARSLATSTVRTALGYHGWFPGSIRGSSEFKRTHKICQSPRNGAAQAISRENLHKRRLVGGAR